MVIRIAMVEDCLEDATRLKEYLMRYSKEEQVDFNIDYFDSAEKFLSQYQAVYALVFLDIKMSGMNGMDCAVELRKKDKVVSIIFITSLIQFAQKGYEVNALSFLIKPINYADIYMKLKKALDLVFIKEEHHIMISVHSGVCMISTDELMYVEIQGHRLKYHLVGETLEMSGNLSKAEKELSGFGFLRCNSCYLVNPKHVMSVKGMDIRVGSEILKISRPKRKAFMTKLTNWLAGENNRERGR